MKGFLGCNVGVVPITQKAIRVYFQLVKVRTVKGFQNCILIGLHLILYLSLFAYQIIRILRLQTDTVSVHFQRKKVKSKMNRLLIVWMGYCP